MVTGTTRWRDGSTPAARAAGGTSSARSRSWTDRADCALPHRIDGLLTIDHVADARAASTAGATRLVAEVLGKRLSDHDTFVVDIED